MAGETGEASVRPQGFYKIIPQASHTKVLTQLDEEALDTATF